MKDNNNKMQPLEIVLKNILGIRKVNKGRIFDLNGFVRDSKEKITQFVFFVPLFQKIRTLININEFSNGATATNISIGGGGGESQNKSILYTIKTCYKLFGIQIWTKTTNIIKLHKFNIILAWRNVDFCNIGKYISQSPNITQEIQSLCNGLSKENKIWLLRQIYRAKWAYESGNNITNLTQDEIIELDRLYTQFLPNIFKINDDLWSYDGYLLPSQIGNAEVFWYKHNMDIFEPQTLATIRNKDIIDVGASIGDSALIFENEFCDKNIYSFEPTKYRYELMLQTIKLNKTSRIIPINKALGSQDTTMVMDNDVNSISYVANNETTEIVEVTTLDNFVKKNNLSIGLIKVDTEGFEVEFLQGAKETICVQKPAMLLSIYHSGKDYFGIKPLIESWNLGYKFKIYKGTDRTITEETMLLCEIVE